MLLFFLTGAPVLSIDADQSIDYGVRQVHEMACVIKRLINDGTCLIPHYLSSIYSQAMEKNMLKISFSYKIKLCKNHTAFI